MYMERFFLIYGIIFFRGERFLENFGIKITGIPEGWGPDPALRWCHITLM
jgi:hypothetical protein